MSTTLLIRGYNPNGRITIPPKTFDKKNWLLLSICILLLIWTI
jgi:energy-coupling factor transporter transmembrane protein EcfT